MAYGTTNVDTIQSSTTGTPVVFKDGSGTQIGTLCRAWVNFNGTGTVAIRASFNVSSITDNGTGDYTVNFTTALPDTNYAVNSMTNPDGVTNVQVAMIRPDLTATSTSLFRIRISNSGGTLSDESVVMLSVFR